MFNIFKRKQTINEKKAALLFETYKPTNENIEKKYSGTFVSILFIKQIYLNLINFHLS